MGTITKTVEVKTCDICKCREDEAQEVIRKCNMCGRDFCCHCGEIYVGQIGHFDDEEHNTLQLCEDCIKKIVKYKEEYEDEDEEE